MNWSSAAERTLEQMLDGSGRISIVTVNGRAAPSLSPSGQGRIYFDSSSNTFKVSQNGGAYADLGAGGAGAPAASKYLVQVADAALPNAQAMGALGTGLVFNTTTTGVQSIYGTSGTGTTVALTDTPTFMTKILVPDGTALAPGLAFSAESGTGLYRSGTNAMRVAVGGAANFQFSPDIFFLLTNGGTVRFGASSDVILSRFAAANLQLGGVATATPVAQTLSAQDGAGTDIAGTVWTLRANRATGAGTPGTIVLAASAAALGTGTTLQTAVPHLTVGGGAVKAAVPVSILDTSAAFYASIAATSSPALTADRTLTLDMGDVAHTLAFGTTANTITFPNAASGTVAMLNVAQTFNVAQNFSSSLNLISGGYISGTANASVTINANMNSGSVAGVLIANLLSFLGTTGTMKHLGVTSTFAPTSGSGTFAALELTSTINQTGGASGISRGLYVNPTLTAAADFRGLEIANVGTGQIAFQTGTGKLGFHGVTAVAQQTSGANLTNNVTVGGTDDTIADFTSLTVYATDAAAIRNDVYQLARKLKQVNDALRLYGFLT